jgi:Zn-finger nucleic acid-binding protein
MNCHNCTVSLAWDSISPIVVCEICSSYRFVDTPDDTANRIVSLNRPGRFHCPRCRSRLTEAAMEGLTVEHCADCQGVLLADEVFAMFVRNRRIEFREAALKPVILVDDQIQNDIHCPSCRRTMVIHPCYGPDFIIVATCGACGTVWLDCSDVTFADKLPQSAGLKSLQS